MMRMADFHNLLRILVSLDWDDLSAAGIIARDDVKAWNSFRNDPFRWFIRADDETARKLWTLIEHRQNPMMTVTEQRRIDPEAAP
jgi:hypothetical protein